MSAKELRRVEILSRVKAGGLKLVHAAELIGVSYRQGKRLWRRFRQRGGEGLQHGNAGRASHRAQPVKFWNKVLDRIRKKYSGEEGKRLGPTLIVEHLGQDDGVQVARETLRRKMLAAGLWSRQRKRRQHRRRREPKEHFGELVQLDGSFHQWFEERGPESCLMNMVDDATGETLCQLHEEETTWAALDVYRAWVEKHGVPYCLYTDEKNVYVRERNAEERRTGKEPLTQFGRICRKMGTRILAARSPQAKGRVERNHGTHQDRLIKKLRLLGIRDRDAANQYLRKQYLPEHNRRFRREPAEEEDYHLPAPSKREMDAKFRLEQERTIGNDWVVRYEGRFLQIERESRYAPAGSKVVVSEGRDGGLQVLYRGRPVRWREIAAPLPKAKPQAVARRGVAEIRKKVHRPSQEHPWRRARWKRRRATIHQDQARAL